MKLINLIKKSMRYIIINGWRSFFYQVYYHLNSKKSQYASWLEQEHFPTEEQLNYQKENQFAYAPKISIITPTYYTPLVFLEKMIQSVLQQTYPFWELCIADASIKDKAIRDKLREYSQKDHRIKVTFLKDNLGISGNTNAALKMAQGEYVTFLDHDDVLQSHALWEVINQLNKVKADIIYSDEDKVNEKGEHKYPLFKPDWSLDLLLSQMYIGHLLVVKKSLINQLGGIRSEYDGSQDYDLMLRLTTLTDKIIHLPKVLYSWRELDTSTSINPASKPYAQMAGFRAVNDYLRKKYMGKAYALETNNLFVYDTRFVVDESKTKVSIIIPFKDNLELTQRCVESILGRTRYSNYEIILLDNNSEKEETLNWLDKISKQQKYKVKVKKAEYSFNWSKVNNQGIDESDGTVLIFLNNDTEIIQSDWMERMTENALREEIGTVGSMLLYPDGTIQHAGVVLGLNGWANHIFQQMHPIHFASPYISPMVNRNVLASTGACLAIAREKLNKIGNFNEKFIICGSDVELSLRAYEFGFKNIYLAGVKVCHLESKSRDSFIPEIDFTMSKLHYQKYWEKGDPYFNINLSLQQVIPAIKEKSND